MVSCNDKAKEGEDMSINRPSLFPGAFMNVLFIVPRIAVPGQYYEYPMGLAYVYAFLKRHEVSVS